MVSIKDDFAILQTQINEHPLVYLDNAATSQKPKQVLDSVLSYYQQENANVHRGLYALSERATTSYENARDKVRDFIHAPSSESVIFTRSTTESINWLAQSFGPLKIGKDDEILLTYLEHHSNIVPWQELAKKVGAKLIYVDLTEDGEIDLTDFRSKLSPKTKIVTFAHVSNVLGSVSPVKKMTSMAHEIGATVIVDGAQAVAHMPVDVSDLDVDFYAFSGHKVYGPTGIGVLYGKKELLETMPPVQFGGEMIEKVGLEESTYQELPWRFEAGTPNIAGAIGLGAAIDYVRSIGFDDIQANEERLMKLALYELQKMDDVQIYGAKEAKGHLGVLSFNLERVHAHDVATILDQEGVEVRAGHHCAQPLMRYLKVPATVRISLGCYNQVDDINRFVQGLEKVGRYFSV